MKNLFSKNAAWGLVALTATTFSFSACNMEGINDLEMKQLKVRTSIADATTRAETNLHEGNFEANEEIKVWIDDASEVYEADGNGGLTGLDLTIDYNTSFSIWGIYPSTVTSTYDATDFTFEIQTDQSEKSGYIASDLMMCEKQTVNYNSSTVPMEFKHLLSKITVNVDNAYADAEISLLNIIPYAIEGSNMDDTSLSRIGTDLAAKETPDIWAAVGMTEKTVNLKKTSTNATSVSGIIPPQRLLTSQDFIQIGNYKARVSENIDLQSGYHYTFNVTVAPDKSMASITSTTIAGWNDGGEKDIIAK